MKRIKIIDDLRKSVRYTVALRWWCLCGAWGIERAHDLFIYRIGNLDRGNRKIMFVFIGVPADSDSSLSPSNRRQLDWLFTLTGSIKSIHDNFVERKMRQDIFRRNRIYFSTGEASIPHNVNFSKLFIFSWKTFSRVLYCFSEQGRLRQQHLVADIFIKTYFIHANGGRQAVGWTVVCQTRCLRVTQMRALTIGIVNATARHAEKSHNGVTPICHFHFAIQHFGLRDEGTILLFCVLNFVPN